MADAGGSQLNIDASVEKRGRGRPRGSKNKSKDPTIATSPFAPAKRHPGRPLGSMNKTKMSIAAPGPSALIRPYCITILYHNLLLFIDIFHI
jgi:hypothetical protein